MYKAACSRRTDEGYRVGREVTVNSVYVGCPTGGRETECVIRSAAVGEKQRCCRTQRGRTVYTAGTIVTLCI